MRRRAFVSLLGGAVAMPLSGVPAAQAQPLPVIGFLSGASSQTYPHLVLKFREGLNESGFVDGENVAIEFRWAEGRFDRLPGLAADLARRRVTVIAATGGTVAALAAQKVTTSIPIVFMSGSNPMNFGLVKSLNRPTANLTGVNLFTNETGEKRLELLHSLVPTTKTIGALTHRSWAGATDFAGAASSAGRLLGLQVHVVGVENESQFHAAFIEMTQAGAGALLVQFTPLFTSRRAKLVSLAAQHKLPALYGGREYADDGGLMSYGSNLAGAYRQVGVYVGRILKGDRPTSLPVVQATKFELVINLKTAKALGLDIPATLLALADEVIE